MILTNAINQCHKTVHNCCFSSKLEDIGIISESDRTASKKLRQIQFDHLKMFMKLLLCSLIVSFNLYMCVQVEIEIVALFKNVLTQ